MKLRREDGQSLVLGVLLMASMLGCAALVLDVGSWFRDKRGLQATADAAALAGAQSLPTDPGGAFNLAVQYAKQNGGDVDTKVNIPASNDTIAVTVANQSPGFFSRLLGIGSVNVDASATARVDLPAQALHVAPMVVNIKHPLLSGPGCPASCFGEETTLDYSSLDAPGAFGMLDLANDGGAVGSSDEGAWILHGFDKYLGLGDYESDPGAKFSSGNVQDALNARLGSVLLFPVYSKLTGTGSNAKYTIVAWVGFHLDSFTVHGNNATLNGYFTRYITEGILSQSGSDQPDFGVRTIQLIH